MKNSVSLCAPAYAVLVLSLLSFTGCTSEQDAPAEETSAYSGLTRCVDGGPFRTYVIVHFCRAFGGR